MDELRLDNPVLVIMDINLPNMNGVETTRRLRAHRTAATTLIIVATGKRDRETVLECIDAGANAYMVKPVTRYVLLSRIGMFLLWSDDTGSVSGE